MKNKETLEEAASKWSLEKAQEFALSRFKNENLLLEGFVSWESILKVFKAGILTGHKFGAKWQQNDCVQFINKLEDDSFDGWSEEAINGYLTACITIKNKLKLK